MVKGPVGLDPALVIKSLDEDAQKIIENYELRITELKHDSYDKKVNEDFIKTKALQIVDREIDRLIFNRNKIMNSGFAFFKSKRLSARNKKISALSELKNQIFLRFPDKSIAKIIEETHPELISETGKHFTKDKLQRIIQMEAYHLDKCNQLDKKIHVLERKQSL